MFLVIHELTDMPMPLVVQAQQQMKDMNPASTKASARSATSRGRISSNTSVHDDVPSHGVKHTNADDDGLAEDIDAR
jgi:hypothetical protein